MSDEMIEIEAVTIIRIKKELMLTCRPAKQGFGEANV
jgi:hypothetical protein